MKMKFIRQEKERIYVTILIKGGRNLSRIEEFFLTIQFGLISHQLIQLQISHMYGFDHNKELVTICTKQSRSF